jgi:hypothetical protein
VGATSCATRVWSQREHGHDILYVGQHLVGARSPELEGAASGDALRSRPRGRRNVLGKWIYENARVPARLYWDHVPLSNVARGLVANGVEPYASYSKLPPDALIPPFMPMQVEVVVTGGSTNGSWNVFSATSMARQTTEESAVGITFGRTTRSVDVWR